MTLDDIIKSLLNKYNICDEDCLSIIEIINPFIMHEEFIKRNSNEFYHHDKTTLAYHIIEDAIVTYKLGRKKHLSDEDLITSLRIAMMHDLYVYPWQNNFDKKAKKFINKHGFRHPIEAVINGITWYSEYFKDDDTSRIIIDGILHHMYPLPVRSINSENASTIELNNYDLFIKLDQKYKDMIYESLSKNVLFGLSFKKTKYIPGKIMRKADKLSSLDNFSSIRGIIALVSGRNNHIK